MLNTIQKTALLFVDHDTLILNDPLYPRVSIHNINLQRWAIQNKPTYLLLDPSNTSLLPAFEPPEEDFDWEAFEEAEEGADEEDVAPFSFEEEEEEDSEEGAGGPEEAVVVPPHDDFGFLLPFCSFDT